jgi:hypothetical protein
MLTDLHIQELKGISREIKRLAFDLDSLAAVSADADSLWAEFDDLVDEIEDGDTPNGEKPVFETLGELALKLKEISDAFETIAGGLPSDVGDLVFKLEGLAAELAGCLEKVEQI